MSGHRFCQRHDKRIDPYEVNRRAARALARAPARVTTDTQPQQRRKHVRQRDVRQLDVRRAPPDALRVCRARDMHRAAVEAAAVGERMVAARVACISDDASSGAGPIGPVAPPEAFIGKIMALSVKDPKTVRSKVPTRDRAWVLHLPRACFTPLVLMACPSHEQGGTAWRSCLVESYNADSGLHLLRCVSTSSVHKLPTNSRHGWFDLTTEHYFDQHGHTGQQQHVSWTVTEPLDRGAHTTTVPQAWLTEYSDADADVEAVHFRARRSLAAMDVFITVPPRVGLHEVHVEAEAMHSCGGSIPFPISRLVVSISTGAFLITLPRSFIDVDGTHARMTRTGQLYIHVPIAPQLLTADPRGHRYG